MTPILEDSNVQKQKDEELQDLLTCLLTIDILEEERSWKFKDGFEKLSHDFVDGKISHSEYKKIRKELLQKESNNA